MSTDIIVVGCGVAGATAAETAASLGSRVLLLEEHDKVGVPSHCSGHVGINSMKRLRVPLAEKVIKNQIRGATFHSPSGQLLRIERKSPVTWVLDRRAFDQHLATRAQKAGVQMQFNSRAVSMQTSDKGLVQLRVRVGGESRVFDCKLVIDCEGAAPKLTPQVLSSERRKQMWVNSAQVHANHVEDLDHDMVEVYLGSVYAPGFFAWIIPWRDGSAKVGLAASEGNPRLLLERFMTKHPDVSRRLKDAPGRDVSFHPMPLGGPISKTFYPGMLIAGDSAQQVKPTTGGGIVFSLICGKTAGEVAHNASAVGDASEPFLSKYERQWKSEIGGDLNVMRRIRRMLFRLPDRQLEKIFSAARTFDVATVLNKADDIDMQSRTLARLGLDPRLMISLLYSSVLSLPFLAETWSSAY
ncbi:geranylgeranyl reductase family protein [[Eubacterium] cellulosolvens]